ncbi:MAG: vanadium-dependent haloperoxidase, partial [Acidobacteriota bacterium]|nr:vanadium-dependent haloperoxidase [Acidobacteriota bacterium]
FIGGTAPGEWRPTPGFTAGTNTFMAFTQPFTLKDASQFRPQPMPPMASKVYAREYEEVKSVGSINSTTRTAAQTDLANFWRANPIATWYGALRGIATSNITSVGDNARLFALASMAAADAQMTIYDSKYHFNFWRPITAIREGDSDGNRDTVGDPDWVPFLGLTGTPPYPEYSSGANCLASSILTTVELILGTGDVHFSIASSVAGLTTNPRPYVRLSDALDDIVDVRIYQGIHIRSGDDEGRRQGARVAHWAYQRFLRPLPGTR